MIMHKYVKIVRLFIFVFNDTMLNKKNNTDVI